MPGEMQDAQRYLELVLDLREEGLTKIATLVRTALGGQGKQASTLIAGDMEMFLTSDVVYSQRVAPLIQQALVADGIHEPTAGTRFLPNLGWLDPDHRPGASHRPVVELGAEQPGRAGHPRLGVDGGERRLDRAGSAARR